MLHIPLNHSNRNVYPSASSCTDLSTVELPLSQVPPSYIIITRLHCPTQIKPWSPTTFLLAWGTLKIFCQHFYIMLWLLSERWQLKTFFRNVSQGLKLLQRTFISEKPPRFCIKVESLICCLLKCLWPRPRLWSAKVCLMLVTDHFLLKLMIAWFTVVQRSNYSHTFYRGHTLIFWSALTKTFDRLIQF